ncbi:MAG: hypothetical protein B7Y90_05680 [Alphaproteobacteria bacterium 32-64-14]|nr:MAG: hypothetical protein B7Y90_05680 [Alphaproteobacteria bacterium 32-64-14]
MTLLRASVLLIAFAVAALCMFPLRLAWAAAETPDELYVETVRGTIWSGELSGVTWRGVTLGDLAITSSILDRPGDLVMTARSDAGPLAAASIPLSARGSVVENVTASADLAALLPGALAGVHLDIREAGITLDGGWCVAAHGEVAIDAIPAQGVPAFDGRLACRNGLIESVLASPDGLHRLTISMTAGASDADPVVTEASPATQLWLAALGIPFMSPEVAP